MAQAWSKPHWNKWEEAEWLGEKDTMYMLSAEHTLSDASPQKRG